MTATTHNYPGNQFEFFKNVCLTEKGEICFDGGFKSEINDLNTNLNNLFSVLSGCCQPTQPIQPTQCPTTTTVVSQCGNISKPIVYEFYTSNRVHKPIKRIRYCNSIKLEPKVIRIDLSNSRDKAEIACTGCYTRMDSRYNECVDRLEAKFDVYNQSLIDNPIEETVKAPPYIIQTPQGNSSFIVN